MKKFFLLLIAFISTGVNASNFVSIEIPQSKIMAETPAIFIALPPSYESDITKTYPVLFVLDGVLNGELVNGMLHRLHLSNGSNEHIIVGIDSADRIRDFAPTVNMDPRGPVGQGGGGDKFLGFLESELIPHINKQYRTTKFNVISGHSIAGLFVIHTFHSRPKLFQAHLAFSPAVWWGARETVASAQNYILSSEDVGGYLYMNIGSESGEMRNVYDSFTQMMIRNRSIKLELELNEFDAVGHNFTMAAGIYNALSGLYKYQQHKGI